MSSVLIPPVEVWRLGYSKRTGSSGGGFVEFFDSRDALERKLQSLDREVITDNIQLTNVTIHRHLTSDWQTFEWQCPEPPRLIPID